MSSTVFVDEKVEFFQSKLDTAESIHQWVNNREKHGFDFLTKYRGSIQREESSIKAVYDANQEDSYALRYYYCVAEMLKNYYNAYSPNSIEAIKYFDLSNQLKKKLNKETIPPVKNTSLFETMANDVSDILVIPFSLDRVRGFSGKLNMQRISTRFSMITVQQFLACAMAFDYLGHLKKFISFAAFNAALGFYNVLSVAVFACRFLANLTLMLKNTFFPQTEESAKLGISARFYEEFKLRHFSMTNDLVWGVVNSLCNYSQFFGIAGPVTNYLLIGFTVFDAAWLGYYLYMIDQDFAQKRQEHEAFIRQLGDDADPEIIALENKKQRQIELMHEKERSEAIFYIVAASVLVSTFSVAFLLASPVFVPVCFLVANVAIAMYLSGAQFGEYMGKRLLINQLENEGHEVNSQVKKELQKAWDNLCFTVAKNTIMPLLIMTAFTVCIPAAIFLTIGYIAYEMGYLTRIPELFQAQQAPAPAL